jgi:molecular chaperone GrpE (heat shock protein)
MNDDFLPGAPGTEPPMTRDIQTLGSSTIYRLCEEVIALREMNNRQHKLFDQTLAKIRDELGGKFNKFSDDVQREYQRFRKEIVGEKRISLTLLLELLELGQDLEHIVANRPAHLDDKEALTRWAEAVEVQSRKVQASLQRHGIYPYDAVISTPYNPALHERVGSKRVEGMGPLLIAEQVERGYASQQPEFVLRRPKVLVSE